MPNQKGSVLSILVICLLSIGLLGAAGFGWWAFKERQSYKNDVDQKIEQAVAVANEQQKSELNKEFAEREKKPYHTYKGPSTYGSISFNYPKNWR